MKGFAAFVALVLIGGLGIVMINGFFIPNIITGTTTGDIIVKILFPVSFAVAIIVAILVGIFGIKRRQQ